MMVMNVNILCYNSSFTCPEGCVVSLYLFNSITIYASPGNHDESDRSPTSSNTNSQITQTMFEKEKGEFRVKVVKQILWVNGMRYELQEIYGIRNSTENDQGKCVICLSEPRDTIVLPCRHMVYLQLPFLNDIL